MSVITRFEKKRTIATVQKQAAPDHPGVEGVREDQQQERDDHGADQQKESWRNAREAPGDALVALLG